MERLDSVSSTFRRVILLYVREGALFAQPFDERAAKARGEPHLLVPNVHYFYGPRHAAFSASQTGVLAYQIAARPSRLVWFDRGGKETGQLGEPAVVKGGLRISPDGARAAVDIENPTTGTSDVWVFEPARGVATRLHSDPVDEVMPVWSADGNKVLYRSDRRGPPDIYEIAVGVPGSEKPVLELPGVQQPEDVSADGKLLAYLNEVATGTWNVWLLPLQGERKPRVWAPTRFDQSSPRFSPDGRWIAFESDESGDPEVYVALTEGGGEKRRISPAGGRIPALAPGRKGALLRHSDRLPHGGFRPPRSEMGGRRAGAALSRRAGDPELRRDSGWVPFPGAPAAGKISRVAAPSDRELAGDAERRTMTLAAGTKLGPYATGASART